MPTAEAMSERLTLERPFCSAKRRAVVIIEFFLLSMSVVLPNERLFVNEVFWPFFKMMYGIKKGNGV